MRDTSRILNKLHSCIRPKSSIVLKLLQSQVTWPFVRKNQQLPFNVFFNR